VSAGNAVIKMKKRLVSLLIGCFCFFGSSGCENNLINREADKIGYHLNEIRKVVEAENDYLYEFYMPAKKGGLFQIIVKGNDGFKSIIYFDSDKDGVYDRKSILSIPKKFLKIIPPKHKEKDPNAFERDYKKRVSELLVYLR